VSCRNSNNFCLTSLIFLCGRVKNYILFVLAESDKYCRRTNAISFRELSFVSRSEIASTGLTISAPQEAGKWSLWALTVSTNGLRFSSPVNVQVFRPLQAEFHLPPSLRVRETLEVDIKIGNNINSCMDVSGFEHLLRVLSRSTLI
jgi:hypothetical protein